MKKTMKYYVNGEQIEKEYIHIPVRFIIAIVLAVLEVAAIIGIVVACCAKVPYFYILAWITQITCVIKIAASDDNPDYKIPWLLFVLIVPIGGFMLYFLFYSRRLKKKYVKRLKDLKAHSYRKNDEKGFEALQNESLSAGVKIYEYEPGFVHAKSYITDDEYAMIGTINLDYRSLVHHFENGVWMYKCEVIRNLKEDICDTMGKSIEVTTDML